MSQQPARRLRPLLLGMAAGLALVLIAVGGIFAFRVLFGGPDFRTAPAQASTTDVSGVGEDVRLVPLHLPGAGQAGGAGDFARLVTPTRSVVYALGETGALEDSRWAAPVPHTDIPAQPREVDFEELWNRGEAAGAGGAGETAEQEPLPPELHGTLPDCALDGADLLCGSTRIGLSDGSVEHGDAGQGSAEHSGGAAPSEAAGGSQDPATAAVPVIAEPDGTLTTAAGVPYPEAAVDPADTVRMVGPSADGEEGPWAVSDGSALFVLGEDSVLWQRQLDAASAAVTGLGSSAVTPGWALVDGVLVLGARDEVHGLDARTGEALWTVGVPGLDSFTVAGTQLRILADGVYTVLDFADPTGEERSTVTAPPSAARAGGLLGPGREAFANGTYELPRECAAFGLHYDAAHLDGQPLSELDTTGDFTDGVAEAGEFHASVTVGEVRPARADGAPVTAVSFLCYGGGAYAYSSIGLYDADRSLLGSVEPWGAGAARADVPAGSIGEFGIGDLGMTGSLLTFNLQGIDLYGDEPCHACAKSASADLVYRWDGGELVHADTVFHVPGGDVRPPSAEGVQEFVDAVAAGDDAAASAHATDAVMELVREGTLGDASAGAPLTVREVQFADTEVEVCELVSANGSPGGYGASEYRFGDGSTAPVRFEHLEGVEPGDVICAQSMPGAPAEQHPLWLLLRADSAGGFEVYEAGRAFS
ncbi:hypothetical protein [Brevibacterium album]|uniref:hypothetical protein n=1 Tax=Brevibacterium album TaxID=417948 RepID=UPI0004912393|nr:hypothetical protein [Brevibacterium album]